MPVRSRFRSPRTALLTTTLMLAALAGCSQDDPATAPDQATPLDGAGAVENNLLSDSDVRTSVVSHYADGYVWAFSPTSASYSANGSYAFNRSGGAITITRQGEGTYTVRFAGLSALLGTKSTVHVTGYASENTYCKPGAQKLLSDVVHIKCFDAASGRPSDAYYTVYITKRYGDLAFAYGNLPTTNDYAPAGSASSNPTGGAIRVFRNGIGNYTVKFSGLGSRLTSNGGHAQAVAIGTGAQHCKIGSWGGSPDLFVSVLCYSRFGDPKDVKFNLFFATPNPHLAYAWANSPTSSSYTPSTFYSSNPNGGVSITRSGTGQYTVNFSGLSLLDGGDVQVTAYSSGNIVCKVTSWGSTSVGIRCFNPATNVLVDSYFDVMYFS